MAPIRRYLRITKYSVLEVRIYLDSPQLAETWLLNARHPMLPRIMASVRPFVLPKLREERDRRRRGGGGGGGASASASAKKKGVKDTVVEDDFEVSIFLTDTGTRHSLLTKHKVFRDADRAGLSSNSTRLTGGGTTQEDALEVDEDAPVVLREESGSESDVVITDIPAAEVIQDSEDDDGDEVDIDDDELFVPQEQPPPRPRRAKRSRRVSLQAGTEPGDGGDAPISKRARLDNDGDDKKKMVMDTFYDGFSIYGKVLCLVIKKRDPPSHGRAKGNRDGNQATMEDWIASTQAPAE